MNAQISTEDLADLQALQNGEEPALHRLFTRYYAWLVGELMRIVPDEEIAKDLSQDVFVEMWRKREQIAVHTSLRAYLKRAGMNRALNYLKANRQLLYTDGEDLPDYSEHPDDAGVEAEKEAMASALHQAIEALPERCRLVFTLSRFSDLSHREISEQLGISVKTIENQITKAFKLLRISLSKHTDLSPVVILVVKWLLEG